MAGIKMRLGNHIYAEFWTGNLDGEIWKEIPYAKAEAYVSNLGRIRLHKRVRGVREVLVVPNKKQYRIGLNTELGCRMYVIGHLVLQAFVGYSIDGRCIHKNNDNTDNRLENLEWSRE
jgi:hypothetical protein